MRLLIEWQDKNQLQTWRWPNSSSSGSETVVILGSCALQCGWAALDSWSTLLFIVHSNWEWFFSFLDRKLYFPCLAIKPRTFCLQSTYLFAQHAEVFCNQTGRDSQSSGIGRLQASGSCFCFASTWGVTSANWEGQRCWRNGNCPISDVVTGTEWAVHFVQNSSSVLRKLVLLALSQRGQGNFNTIYVFGLRVTSPVRAESGVTSSSEMAFCLLHDWEAGYALCEEDIFPRTFHEFI